jgi:hypothetical protein
MALLASVMDCRALYIVLYQAMDLLVSKPLQSMALAKLGFIRHPFNLQTGSAAQ